jgi:hypothetical protein
VSEGASSGEERISAAEVIAALSLATDLSIGFDFEHGLRSTLVAVRLAERLDVDPETAAQSYYACLLQQVGCTADIHVRAEILGDTAAVVRDHLMPVWFGEPREVMAAMARSVAPGAPLSVRVMEVARKVPRAALVVPRVDVACREVARMLAETTRTSRAANASSKIARSRRLLGAPWKYMTTALVDGPSTVYEMDRPSARLVDLSTTMPTVHQQRQPESPPVCLLGAGLRPPLGSGMLS